MQIPLGIILNLFLLVAGTAVGQQPAPAPPAQEAPPTATPQTPRPESSSTGKSKRLPGYLVTGTIFSEKAMAYPNVRVQIRREGEKKFRWETFTNSRGEFAVRVPEGKEYEVVVKEKSYKEVALKLNANNGELEQRLSVRLEKANEEKGGATK